MLPSVLLIGPNKCATTSLHHELVQQLVACRPTPVPPHSNRLAVRVAHKEIQFFSRDARFALGVSWYMRNFNSSRLSPSEAIGCGGRFIDSSPEYFYAQSVVARVYGAYPSALRPRLIAVLREPVERGISAFNFYYGIALRKRGVFEQALWSGGGVTRYSRLAQDQLEALHANGSKRGAMPKSRTPDATAIEVGFYAEHLRRWLFVGPERLFVAAFSDIVTNVPAYVARCVLHCSRTLGPGRKERV